MYTCSVWIVEKTSGKGRWTRTAPKLRVVVEVDGGYHQRRKAADAKRDARISRLGWRVVRVSDELVERDVEAALEVVRAALEVG